MHSPCLKELPVFHVGGFADGLYAPFIEKGRDYLSAVRHPNLDEVFHLLDDFAFYEIAVF